jgi:predicted Zn finger-like uncharacterized protein
MSEEILGVAVCDECNARIRVLKKLAALVGKTVRCPRCHTRFTLVLEAANEKDRIAIESDQAAKQNRKKRRSKDQIRNERITAAREGLRALHERLKAIGEVAASSEEQIRVWCLDALRTALGYEDCQLDTECKVMGGRIDIAIKEGGEVKVIIECKNIRSKLHNSVREQAGVYAATLSAPWAVVTNGDIWKLYRVTPQKGVSPRMDLVFDIALLDEDGISEHDAEKLYLLSHRALTTGDTEAEYHDVRCSSPARVYEALFSERVLSALRVELSGTYKEEAGQAVKLTNEGSEDALRDLLTPLEFGS